LIDTRRHTLFSLPGKQATSALPILSRTPFTR
jgi:hypothetical protein